MPGGDNERWSDARWSGTHAIFKDANVVVSNGTVKLQVKKEQISWHCDTCTDIRQKNYSAATLCLPYTKAFNAGKFEARIKMPVFRYAHSTFWTWWGAPITPGDSNSLGVNEIDIAEAYGKGTNGWFWGDFPKTNYSLHAWNPGKTPATNPYNLPPVEDMNRYPGQDWWNFIWGNQFEQDNFHTYACEWDTALIRISLDGNLISEFWKYYQTKQYKKWWNPWYVYDYRVGSGCNPAAGIWKVMPGFPWFNHSESNLRFSVSLDEETTYGWGTVLGEMEVDYVKMWQKHFDNDWANICDPAASQIVGPDIICSTATYQAVPPAPGGYWLPPTNLTVLSSNNASITVQKSASPSSYEGYVYYYPLDPSCDNTTGVFTKWKRMDVGAPATATVVCSQTHNAASQQVYYNLRADPNYTGTPGQLNTYHSPTTFEWVINYGPNFNQHQHLFGQTVSTPPIPYTPGTMNSVKWTLIVTNACGSVTKNGRMDFLLMKKKPGDSTDRDPDHHYIVANITDINAYQSAVRGRLERTFIPETGEVGKDTLAVLSKIEEIEMQELAPYLLLDSADVQTINTYRRTNTKATTFEGETMLYPNPATSYVNIRLGKDFDMESPVFVRIYDVVGKLERSETYEKLSTIAVSVLELPPGLHSVELQQGRHKEFQKLLKQ